MIRNLAMLMIAATMLVGCAPKGYITVVAPKKSEEEKKQATAIAERIFPITNGESLVNLQKDLAKPENQEKIRSIISKRVDDSSLGECLIKYGFADYFTQQTLAAMTPSKLRTETIRLWVEKIPMDMFKKADKVFSDQRFRSIYLRMTKMEDGDIRTKLNKLVDEKFITPGQANEFFLTVEDRDIKTYLIITQSDGKNAIHNLMAESKRNPAGVILEFMKTNPAANEKCSFLKGSSL